MPKQQMVSLSRGLHIVGIIGVGPLLLGVAKEVKLLSNRFGNIEGAGPEYENRSLVSVRIAM